MANTIKTKKMKQGQKIHGFLVKRVVYLRNLNNKYYELEHIVTGARYIHLENEDKENTFLVAFKTIPTDSSGAAHILEHSVLAGSNKYPVKDPFFSMNKRSLKTFMNAFTSDDWTGYPFSTQNEKDFYNLMSVYLDSVFYPKLSELTIRQEGCRLEFLDGKLVYKGVVYNEMKGVMSSPERIMSDSLNKSLYPNSSYRFNAGGDPAVIPYLTDKQLKEFYCKHYHPSNAYFYSYGNLSLEKHLKYLEEKVLINFERLNLNIKVLDEPSWMSPKKLNYYYPASSGDEANNKFQACLAWLTAPIADSFETLTLELIEDVLLGNSASPLRKALIDSKLGSDLSDETGFSNERKETMFTCGLKDVKKEDIEKVKKIILLTIKNLVNKGIDKELFSSSLHKFEINKREITNYPYPYGLKLFLDFFDAWIHDGDPVRFLQYEDELKEIEKRVASGKFLEQKIKKYFLENNNRVFLILGPDKKMQKKEDIRVKQELESLEKNLTSKDKKKIKNDSRMLKKLQESEEDLSCLPKLQSKDIPRKIKKINPKFNKEDRTIASFEQPTNGLFYFSSAFKADNIAEDLISLVPFFCYLLPKMGTKNKNYIELARNIDAYTGGIYLSPKAGVAQNDSKKSSSFVVFNAKCLEKNCKVMFSLISEIIREFDFSDKVALKNFLFEYKARLESSIIEEGHRYATLLASSGLSYSSKLNEQWHGIHQLLKIQELATDLDNKKLENLIERLCVIGKNLFLGQNTQVALIGNKRIIELSSNLVLNLKRSFSQERKDCKQKDFKKENLALSFVVPSTVSFTACCFKTVFLGHKDAPALYIASKIIANKYLHREIREKGGAYGGYSRYSPEEGIFSFLSYRDPHIAQTLNSYSGAMSYIKSGEYSEEDINEAILQACSEIDKPDAPADAAKGAFYRKLYLLSDEKRQNFKKNLLNIKRADVIQASKHFKKSWQECSVAVLSSQEKIEGANRKIMGKKLKILK